MKKEYRIQGLDCPEEVALLEKALLVHVDHLTFDLMEGKMGVTFNPEKISEPEIISKIRATGLSVVTGKPKSPCGRIVATTLSALFLVGGLFSYYPHYFFGASLICGLFFVVPKAYFAFKQRHFDMHILMIVAVIGALFIDQWFEAASVAFLFSLALLLEQWSIQRARTAITALMDLAPKKGRVVTLRGFVEKEVGQIEIGDHILIQPGEKVPLDAFIIEGRSTVDQSPITGESTPVYKDEGNEVFAGTINQEGALTCRVHKKVDDTLLAQVIHLVDEARSKKAPSESFVTTFAKYYTPVMFCLALLVLLIPPLLLGQLWPPSLYRALVLLVIACPCALVISTPVSIVSGLTLAAKKGVLIKGGLYLEEVGKIRALALDKTGTLTYGRPEVQKILPFNHHTEEELLERAVALERPSEHPLAHAIVRRGGEMHVENATQFQCVPGKGARAYYQGRPYWIGSHRYMHEVGQETEEIHEAALALEDEGHSVVAIGNDEHVCGLISLADYPRENIRDVIRELKREGVREIVMLTGDNEPTAQAIADVASVDRFLAELLPSEKMEEVGRMVERYGKVAMVGDGVNDAPAMARASIGIAMGVRGTDAAIETSDIALMSDDLSKVPWLMNYSRRVTRVIKQNIFFALGVKLLFVMLAIPNLTTLWMAIGADTGATLLVIFNALRLLRK